MVGFGFALTAAVTISEGASADLGLAWVIGAGGGVLYLLGARRFRHNEIFTRRR
jgi:hypothetical protein